MKLRRPRLSEVLELSCLLAGGVLISYYACRGKDDAAPAARESRTFAAERAEPIADTADGEARRSAVEAAVRELISGVALGEVDETRRADAQVGLVSLLERWNWGTEANRSTAAAVIVQQIFDRSKLGDRSIELTAQQVRAIQGVARELTRELLLLAVGSSPGADGITLGLPPGHARVTWNQLGGFPYVQGGPLPPEVTALAGKPTAIFGFMLTLGDSEQLREFVLVESLWGCCFGAVPDVNQTILVRLAPGTAAEYSATPQLVTGRLEVGEEREGGFVTSLYRLVDARVKPVDAAP